MMQYWILAALVVYLIGLYTGSVFLLLGIGPKAYLGSRDIEPDTLLRGRALRASRNLQENLLLFLPLALLAMILETADMAQALLGAKIFVLARIAYLPMYLAAVPLVRSLMYLIGLFGVFLMVIAIL